MAAERSQGLGALTFVNPHLGAEGAPTFHDALIKSGIKSGAPAGDDSVCGLGAIQGVQIIGAGTQLGLSEFLERTHTTSLLVMVEGETVVESYADGLGPSDLFLGASMTKSVLASLVGHALLEGQLSLETRVGSLIPELSASGYAGCNVRHLLSMTSGVDWLEDHRDPESRASRLLASFGVGTGGSRDQLATVPAGVSPGQRFAYNTADSQVLDWVRERATGLPYADALGTLWEALGCEADGVLRCDGPPGVGVALAGGGLAATTRDWARLGQLQLTGLAGDTPYLSKEWIDASSRPAEVFTVPGALPSNLTTHVGFGWHWWPLDESGRRVTADGALGQFTYLDRDLDVIVVKTSQWPYDEATDRQCRDLCYRALPAIAQTAAADRRTTERLNP